MVIEKKYHFYAAHRNEKLNDKCFNLHGHVYRLIISIKAPIKQGGVSFLFNDIDKYVCKVIDKMDHGCFVNINDEPLMEALHILGTKKYILPDVSSTENIAIEIYRLLKRDGLPIFRITLKETESSQVVYEPNT